MRRRRAHSAADLTPNLTSLIDVTFLLIVFFVLVSKIVEIEQVGLNLPEAVDPRSGKPDREHQAVLNVILPGEGQERGYSIRERFFPADPAGVEAMTQHLAGIYAADPQVRVNLRADRRTTYEYIHPAMKAVTLGWAMAGQSDAPKINLVIEPARQSPG